jgi:hypothetical protein
MVPAAKISWNVKTKSIDIENFSAIDLINVESKKP